MWHLTRYPKSVLYPIKKVLLKLAGFGDQNQKSQFTLLPQTIHSDSTGEKGQVLYLVAYGTKLQPNENLSSRKD